MGCRASFNTGYQACNGSRDGFRPGFLTRSNNMSTLVAIPIGLLLSIYGDSIGRNLWQIDARVGLAWRSERDYILSMRWVGAVIIAIGLMGWGYMAG